jgi:hypothetical protein
VKAADPLGWSEEIGTIDPGKRRILSQLMVTPLREVNSLEYVKFVGRAGR